MNAKPALFPKPQIKVSSLTAMSELLEKYGLNTVCQDALCPNRGECSANKTATFLILGKLCTRNCSYCSIAKGQPLPLDFQREHDNIIRTIQVLNLKHVVITSVTRDDLSDGGAGQYQALIQSIHKYYPDISVEVLIPDFLNKKGALEQVIDSQPEVINHNLETVPRLFSKIRPKANFDYSLNLLTKIKSRNPKIVTKSGLMIGLGESLSELISVFEKLKKADCDIVTVGQYLQPTVRQTKVVKYYLEKEYKKIRQTLTSLRFKAYAVGPFVRSSYQAEKLLWQLK